MTKEERAKAACKHCRDGSPRRVWLNENIHEWVKQIGAGSSQYSTTVCQADSIWKEKEEGNE